jgi:hypothetical protein
MRSELPNDSISRRDENGDSYASWMANDPAGVMRFVTLRRLAMSRIFCALILGMLVGQGVASAPAYGAEAPPPPTVAIDGGYRTTVLAVGHGQAPNLYNANGTTLFAHYTIATKVDPATGQKVFDLDPEKSYVVFENEFKVNGKNFMTDKVPVTKVEGDPNTGVITSFDVKGTSWDPARPPPQSAGIEGHVELPKDGQLASGWLTSTYNLNSGSKYSYSFQSDPVPASLVKAYLGSQAGHPEVVGTRIGEQKSLDYNAATGTLSIDQDTVINTPVASDPILGATLTFPEFDFTGLTTDDGKLAIFWATGDGFLTMANGGDIYERSSIPILYYSVDQNLFYGGLYDTTLAGMPPLSPFYDPSLPNNISSDFLDNLGAIFDPSSPGFDPLANLYVTITPDTNYFALTNGFTVSGGTGANDLHFAADPALVPEPSTLGLFGFGLLGLAGMRVFRSKPAGDVI